MQRAAERTSTTADNVFRTLCEKYYRDSRSEDPEASSYWKYYGPMARIEPDSEGHVASLDGVAFGSPKWRGGFAERAMHRAGVFFQLATLPHRLAILRRLREERRLLDRMGLDMTFDTFRHAHVVELLSRSVSDAKRVLLIGDGFGIVGAMLKQMWPDAQIVFIDLGRTLAFQAFYCGRAFPTARHGLVTPGSNLADLDFAYCAAEDLPALEGMDFDLAVNVASMQEIAASSRVKYFDFLRRNVTGFFYCCNRVSKTLPDGEVSAFHQYPWVSQDRHIIDEPCRFYSWFPAPGRADNPVTFLGVRVPFAHRYDGPIWHRLTRLEARSGVEERFPPTGSSAHSRGEFG